jgi:hypothetical protein
LLHWRVAGRLGDDQIRFCGRNGFDIDIRGADKRMEELSKSTPVNMPLERIKWLPSGRVRPWLATGARQAHSGDGDIQIV